MSGWIVERMEWSERGRHVRSGASWRPLPATSRPGRHVHADGPDARRLAAVSVLGILTMLVSVAATPARSAASSPPSTVTSSATIVTLPPTTSSSTTTTTTTTPLVLPALDTSTTLGDHSPDALREMHDRRAADREAQRTATISGVAPLSLGGLAPEAAVPPPAELGREHCIRDAKTSPLKVDERWDRNLVAQMTHGVFSCLSSVAGLDEVAPTALRRWNGARAWGFGSLAEQVAAEAVVVAYCESEGFRPGAITGSNPYGYAGLFQMGATEMRRFGEAGGSRYDPVDNAVAAANYFIYQYRNRAGWGGWSPWAVVNTNFDDEVNDRVKVPVLPRFVSTDPEFAGRRGAELPAWAVDPWSWHVPTWSGTGCPTTGGRWPGVSPLDPTS